MRLEGKVAIVTGSSRGIGACIARRYGKEGARVAVVAHTNLDTAEAVAGEIVAAGGEAKAFQADVAKVSECDRLAGEVKAAFGTVDILVNNAGIFFATTIEETTEDIWNSQVDLNMKGSFFMARAVVPGMKAKGGGKIINVTSIAGVRGFPNSGAYCSSKGGQVNMVNALCLELAKDGINVNSLAPGNIKTDMNAPYRAEPGYDEHQASLTPTGLGHMDPEELTGAAVFLASSDADQVHGANLLVDGGWSAW
ncbi:MAG: SDR family oxidoreductase [Alphaproteobacteria bacterium]|nr:SDR family oxidoreductase [Alphaproteobacteria bacterium]